MRKWTDEPAIDEIQLDDLVMVADVSRTAGQRNTVGTVEQLQAATVGPLTQRVTAGEIPRGPTANRPDPPEPDTARLFWDETLGHLICHNGTAWVNLDGSSL